MVARLVAKILAYAGGVSLILPDAHVLVWEEDGGELSTSTSVQETTALVDGVETLTLV